MDRSTVAAKKPLYRADGLVNRFRPFNNFFDYAEGNKNIVQVSHVLRTQIEPLLDVIVHLGGDNFVLVMCGWTGVNVLTLSFQN